MLFHTFLTCSSNQMYHILDRVLVLLKHFLSKGYVGWFAVALPTVGHRRNFDLFRISALTPLLFANMFAYIDIKLGLRLMEDITRWHRCFTYHVCRRAQLVTLLGSYVPPGTFVCNFIFLILGLLTLELQTWSASVLYFLP